MANRMPRVAQLRAVSGGTDSGKSGLKRRDYLQLALVTLLRVERIPNGDALVDYWYRRADEVGN